LTFCDRPAAPDGVIAFAGLADFASARRPAIPRTPCGPGDLAAISQARKYAPGISGGRRGRYTPGLGSRDWPPRRGHPCPGLTRPKLMGRVNKTLTQSKNRERAFRLRRISSMTFWALPREMGSARTSRPSCPHAFPHLDHEDGLQVRGSPQSPFSVGWLLPTAACGSPPPLLSPGRSTVSFPPSSIAFGA
jgi:hypothetical protein